MHKRKIIIVLVLVVLGIGLAVFLLTRDTGPPVVVQGNFSAKDVAQIKSAVRRERWREAFPNCSWKTIKALPGSVRMALNVHVYEISAMSDANGQPDSMAFALLSQPQVSNTWSGVVSGRVLTNGPNGWICCSTLSAGWTSYTPELQ